MGIINRYLLRLVSLTLLTIGFVACSGQQQAEDLLEVSDDTAGNITAMGNVANGNFGGDDAGENSNFNDYDNYDDDSEFYDDNQFANDNEFSNSEFSNGNEFSNDNQFADSEGYNSAIGNDTDSIDDFMEGTNATLNFGGNTAGNFLVDNATLNGGMNEGPILNEGPLLNDSADLGMNPGFDDTLQAAQQPYSGSTAVPTSDMAPIPGGRVRYVPAGGVEVMNAPNGSVVASLGQGDHPITWDEGGWLKLGAGRYVPSGALSDGGIGREKYQPEWR